jgi:hypothetical protein
MNCVIATLLIVSITINILAFIGFKLVRDDEQYKNSGNENNSVNYDYDYDFEAEDDDTVDTGEIPSVDVSVDDNKEEIPDVNRVLVYEDRNIKVTYCGLKDEFYELTYLFEIENKSSKTLNVTFDDLYINGKRVYVSGLTCEDLLPATAVMSDFVVKDVEFDFDKNQNSEMSFTFNIKLMNANSYLDLYETDSITVTIK